MSVRLPLFAGCLLTFLPLSQSGLAAAEVSHPLIVQLGHADFDQRVAAERALLKLGPQGLPLVEQAAQSPDPEVRTRSRRLLSLLRQQAFELSRQSVRNTPWTQDAATAPDWARFQSMTGDGAAARGLFIEMIDAEPELMLGVVHHPQSWTKLFERRCAALRIFADPHPHREPGSASIAALLFLSQHPDNHASSEAANVLSSLALTTAFNRGTQQGERGEILREILNCWISASSDTLPAPHRLALAKSYDLPGALAAAKEILDNRQGVGRSRMQVYDAVRYLARHGGADAIVELQEFLDEDQCESCRLTASVMLPHQPQADMTSSRGEDTFARDAALLGLIQLTAQDPLTYGIQNADSETDLSYGSISASFASDADRRAAREQWNQWRARHLHTHRNLPLQAITGIAL